VVQEIFSKLETNLQAALLVLLNLFLYTVDPFLKDSPEMRTSP